MQPASLSPEPETIAASVRRMLHAARPGAARPLLAAFERMAPQSPVLAELESAVAAAEGNISEAIAALDRGLALAPANAGLRKRRAGLRERAGDRLGALGDAAEAVIAAPSDAAAKALLGLLLLETGRLAEACACLAEAVATEPGNPDFRIGLAEAASRAGETLLARASLAEGIARAPGRADLRAAAVRAALSAGDPASAERLAEAARSEGAADASVLRLLAEALALQGQNERAAATLAQAWKLNPADPALRYFAAASGLLPAPDRAPIEIFRTRFHSIFQNPAHGTTAWENRLSERFLSAVLTHFPPSSGTQIGPVLDLGCASGLACAALSDVPFGPLIGVDAAPLTQSLSGLRYAELHDADPLAFLDNERRSFPLILAGDLFSWFGPLESLFAALAPRLAPDGALIFSFDSTPPAADANEDWRLRPDGRYAHSEAWVARAARTAGLVPRRFHAEPPHDQDSASGTAMIAVLDRAADAD